MVEIIADINRAQFWLIMIGLGLGAYRFKRLDMIGPWFKWKLIGYSLITLYDWFFIHQVLDSNLTLQSVLRLFAARFVVNIEVWYCMHWRFYKMNGRGHALLESTSDERASPTN